MACDLAETYQITDMRRQLTARQAARLARGLRADSRVMRKLTGRAPPELTLQAMAVDSLRWLQWAQTRDARRGRNRPESIALLLNTEPEQNTRRADAFDSGADFRKAWEEAAGSG